MKLVLILFRITTYMYINYQQRGSQSCILIVVIAAIINLQNLLTITTNSFHIGSKINNLKNAVFKKRKKKNFYGNRSNTYGNMSDRNFYTQICDVWLQVHPNDL